jgi:ATP-dependent RNA helicase DDX55/SPB4
LARFTTYAQIERTDFLRLRKIPVQPLPQGYLNAEDQSASLTDEMRKVVASDRDLDDKVREVRCCPRAAIENSAQGSRAFVSFVRSYSKHEASYIFRLKDLDLPGLAMAYGLLRLPKMPELKDVDRSSWTEFEMDVRGFELRT